MDDSEQDEVERIWSIYLGTLQAILLDLIPTIIMYRMDFSMLSQQYHLQIFMPLLVYDCFQTFPVWCACWAATEPRWGCSKPVSHIVDESSLPESSTSHSTLRAESHWRPPMFLAASIYKWRLEHMNCYFDTAAYLGTVFCPKWWDHWDVVPWRPEQQPWWSPPIGAPLFEPPRRECSLASPGDPQWVLVWTASWGFQVAHDF